jgi:hypothetical protein
MKLNPMNTTGEKLHVFSQQSAAPLSPRKLETQKTQAPNMKPHTKNSELLTKIPCSTEP